MEAEAPPCGGDAPAPACPWSDCGLLPLREHKAKARTVWAGNGSPIPKGREAPYDGSREGRHHLAITNKEAMSIISSNEAMKNVIDEYKKKVEWTSSRYFINSFLADYMLYECNMSEKRINANMDKLNRHGDVKIELYETLIYEKFPVAGAIKVCGYTAEALHRDYNLSPLGAYNYLVYLKEDPDNALACLQAGLPRK